MDYKEDMRESVNRVMAAANRYRDALSVVRTTSARIDELQSALEECEQKRCTWAKELDEAREELHRAAMKE